MQRSDGGEQKVVELSAYRARPRSDEIIRLPADRVAAEELLNEIIHHLLAAVRAITAARS